MRSLLIFLLLVTAYSLRIQAQCILSTLENSQTLVLQCITDCGCSTVDIPAGVTIDMMGSLDLSSAGAISFHINGNASLQFSGTGNNQADPAEQLILAAGSILVIEDSTNSNALVQSGSPGKIRINIGGTTFTGNDFPQIIQNGGADENGFLSALPVELVFFTAKWRSEGFLTFSWSGFEDQLAFYTIEQLTQKGSYTTLQKVEALGTLFEYQHTVLALGGQPSVFRLKVQDWNGEISYSKHIQPLGIAGPIVSLYPNPITDGLLFIQGLDEDDIERIEIYQASGKLVWQQAYSIDRSPIRIAHLPAGLYHLKGVGKKPFWESLTIEPKE